MSEQKKEYHLIKTNFLGMDLKKIHYNFKIEQTNNPTKFIKIVIHHTGKNRTISNIIDNHIKKLRYSSIGYHFLIGKRGQIYLSRDLKCAGAHTFKYNKNSIGIALFGNFDEKEPEQKQIESLNLLIEILKENFDIRKIYGHNQAIYELIKKKFWKLNLEEFDYKEFKTKENYNTFIQKITTKILENEASENNLEEIKRLKSCPGFNMYKYLDTISK